MPISSTWWGGNNYSTEEQVIGTWIDGKPLYQKVIDCGGLPTATSKNVSHNISNLANVVRLEGYAYYSGSGGEHLCIPFNSVGATKNYGVQVMVRGTNIILRTAEDMSDYSESYVTLQYTKTTD